MCEITNPGSIGSVHAPYAPPVTSGSRIATGAKWFLPHAFKKTFSLLEPASSSELIIQIPLVFYQKSFNIVDQVPDEGGWLGEVERSGPNGMKFKIREEAYIFDQAVNGTMTRFDIEAIGKFFDELLRQPDGMERNDRIRLWMHCHYGSTSPSGTYCASPYGDLSQMYSFKRGFDWFIMGIADKKGGLRFDIFFYDLGYKVEDVPWEVTGPEDGALRTEIKAELDAKVRYEPPTTTAPAVWCCTTNQPAVWQPPATTLVSQGEPASNPWADDGWEGI